MKKKELKKQLGELAIYILSTAEIDDRAEDGEITVDPDLLFRFLVERNLLRSLAKKAKTGEKETICREE